MIAILAILFLPVAAASGSHTAFVIPLKPDPPPAVDGQLTEWLNRPGSLVLDHREQATWGGNTWQSAADLSARVWLAWRADTLYLAASVTDDRLRQAQRGEGLFGELELKNGESVTNGFTVATLPADREVVLALKARMQFNVPAGHTPALQVRVNGRVLNAARLINKPPFGKANDGRIHPLAAGKRFSTFYAPDFTSADEWAIVPVARPDYFDFVNAVRRLCEANFTIRDCFAFLRAGPLTQKWSDTEFANSARCKSANLLCATIDWPMHEGLYPHGTAFQLIERGHFKSWAMELHDGWIVGKERIITKRSGLFGWGDKSCHEVHAYDENGRELREFKSPLIRRDGANFSELRLAEGWSAVVIADRKAK